MTDKPRRPTELTDTHSRRFWERHLPALWDAGTVTDRDVESFTLLAQVWGRLQQLAAVPPGPENYRAMVQYVNLTKQYQQLAARFDLIGPKGRPEKPKQTLADVIAQLNAN